MSTTANDLERLSIDTIRTLSMDAVEAANSGHPGTPMALAPVAYAIWQKFLRFDPEQPLWPNRDRFVLSCGHASMLLYSLLHLAQVKQCDQFGDLTDELACPLEHLKKFRQLHSRCPGHPEYRETTGVETTTGPLGQGIGNSVGMAIAQRWLAAHFNRPGYELFNYRIYALCSDGDLMEGISAEAASLAGHLGLGNLCWVYDDNKITIEGDTHLAFSEDVAKRFTGLGWNVKRVEDANDVAALTVALKAAAGKKDRPTLIIVRSHIAWGAPNKQDTHGAHGAPLGAEEIRLTKAAYGWPPEESFRVPTEVLDDFRQQLGERGAKLSKRWQRLFKKYAKEHPDLAAQWQLIDRRELPADWETSLPVFPADAKGLATRVSSGKVLNALAAKIPWLVGGSADLAPSTMTLQTAPEAKSISASEPGGRNMHFGIREHAMGSAVNGMALGGLRAYGSTFLVFSDYMRPAIRLSAIMHLPALFIFTHDSIGVGEDGPTHQPVEHVAALRAIPRLLTIRPGDANEVAQAYRVALRERERPVALVLTRQNLPTLDRTKYASAEGTLRGGYVLSEAAGGAPRCILLATGSEVSLCLSAQKQLQTAGLPTRVVSLPCWQLFDEQDAAYRDSVLPASVGVRVAVEAGIVQGWEKYLGPQGRFVGMQGYGASAPGGVLAKHFGLTAENVVAQAKAALGVA